MTLLFTDDINNRPSPYSFISQANGGFVCQGRGHYLLRDTMLELLQKFVPDTPANALKKQRMHCFAFAHVNEGDFYLHSFVVFTMKEYDVDVFYKALPPEEKNSEFFDKLIDPIPLFTNINYIFTHTNFSSLGYGATLIRL